MTEIPKEPTDGQTGTRPITPEGRVPNPIQQAFGPGPADPKIEAAFDASWKTQAEEINKDRPLLHKVLRKGKVKPEDVARQELQTFAARVEETLQRRGLEATEENLSKIRIELSAEFRPKKPIDIRSEAYLKREGQKALQALKEGNWKAAAKAVKRSAGRFYPDNRPIEAFLSQTSQALHARVAEVVRAKDGITFVKVANIFDQLLPGENHLDVNKLTGITEDDLHAEDFWKPIEDRLASRIQSGRVKAFGQEWRVLEGTKIVNRETINELPSIVTASGVNVGQLLRLGPAWEVDAKDRISFFSDLGMEHASLLEHSGAIRIVGNQIDNFLKLGPVWEADVTNRLAFSQEIGLDKSRILEETRAVQTIAGQLTNFLKLGAAWEVDVRNRLAFAQGLGLDQRVLLAGTGDIATGQINSLLKLGGAWEIDVKNRLAFFTGLEQDILKILEEAEAARIIAAQVANFQKLGQAWEVDANARLSFADEIGIDSNNIRSLATRMNRTPNPATV